MALLKLVGLLWLTLILTACSPSSVVNGLSHDFGRCKQSEIVFDKEHTLALDIYYSEQSSKCSGGTPTASYDTPTIVFIYGGSWTSGEKSTYSFVADFFTHNGFNVIIPNYRTFPQAAYPTFIHDMETFFNWYAKNAKVHSLNSESVFLMAHSAGAYNSAMYLLDKRYKKPLQIEGFIGLAGPYDYFLPTNDPKYKPIFEKNGKQYNSAEELPINKLSNSPTSPPLKNHLKRAFILHGEDDTLVKVNNAERFSKALSNAGVQSHHRVYPEIDHVQLISGVTLLPILGTKVRKDILQFIREEK